MLQYIVTCQTDSETNPRTESHFSFPLHNNAQGEFHIDELQMEECLTQSVGNEELQNNGPVVSLEREGVIQLSQSSAAQAQVI